MRVLRRSLPWLLATTIVAAFQSHLAAAVTVSEDVPVAGLAAVARALGIDPPPERARFISEITRLANNISADRRALASSLARSAEPTVTVPVPLPTAVWSDAVFRRRVAPGELVSEILADRQAALLCHGLAALDDQTLQFLIERPDVVAFLYQRAAAAFAGFANSLRIRGNRVVTPGGDAAIPLWQSAVGEEVTRPDRFVRQLFSRSEGRLAYLYDGISQLEPPHAAFALGLWMTDGKVRASRFKALIDLARGAHREWKIGILPFARPIHDVISLLTRVRVAPDGRPLPPASRSLWARVLESDELPADGSTLPDTVADDPFDAAWLADTMLAGELHQRSERLDQLSFGQRAFSSAPAADRLDVFLALRAFERYRTLVLTLDRLGVTNPGVYAAAVRHASRLSTADRSRAAAALAQFQSALAFITRLHLIRSIDLKRTEALVTSLAAVPVSEDGYRGYLLEWFDRELRGLSTGDVSVEDGLIARLAGVRSDTAPGAEVEWEGQVYRFDLPTAEERRIRQIREKQNGLPLDLALDLATVARRLTAESTPADGAQSLGTLKAAVAAITAWSKSNFSGVTGSADLSRELLAPIERVASELDRATTPADARRTARIAEPLMPVAETIAADAMLSLAYAIDLGDPEGTVLNAGNVAHRHDFGIGIDDGAARTRFAWSIPRQEVAPGVPWHVRGSALGLDLGLASLGLRRVDTTRVADAPRLTSNERQTFALSVALLNPFTMTDADRNSVAEAIARGADRIRMVTPATVEPLAADAALDGRRRRALQWAVLNDPDHTASLFSLTELLYLGGAPAQPVLDAWGMAGIATSGCLCTRLARPGQWLNLIGRPQLGLLSTAVADVNLRVAFTLRELGLPAGIARHVLSAAVQDYIDEVRPSDTDDWLTLVRTAQLIPRERIEDYVAAVTADGPLIPVRSSGSMSR